MLPGWAWLSFEGFPVLNASGCTSKIMIAVGLEHLHPMVKYHLLPLKELKGFLKVRPGP